MGKKDKKTEEPSYKLIFHESAPLLSDFITVGRTGGIYIMNFRSTLPEILGKVTNERIELEVDLETLSPHTRIAMTKDVLTKLKEQIEKVLNADSEA